MPKHSGQKWSSGGLTASRGAPRFPLTPFTLRPHPHLSTLQAHPTKQFPVLGWLWDPSSRNPWPWAARAPRFPGETWLPRREQMHPPPKLTDRGMATWKAMEIIPAKMKGTQPPRREQRRHPGPLAMPSSQHPLGRDLRPREEGEPHGDRQEEEGFLFQEAFQIEWPVLKRNWKEGGGDLSASSPAEAEQEQGEMVPCSKEGTAQEGKAVATPQSQ